MPERRFSSTDASTQEIIETYSNRDRAFTIAEKRDILERIMAHQAEASKLMLCAVVALTAAEAPKLGGEIAGLLTPKEAAQQLGVKVGTVYRLRKEGALPAVHVGRWVRFDPEDIKAYRRRQKKREPTAGGEGHGAGDDQDPGR